MNDSGAHAAPTGQLAFPIRRLTYTFSNNQLWVAIGTQPSQGLVNNVSAFGVTFGVASTATDIAASSYTSNPSDPAHIRSVRLTLTLTDPNNRVRNQTYNVVAALRNRLL